VATTWLHDPAATAPAGLLRSVAAPPRQSRNVTAPLELIRSRYWRSFRISVAVPDGRAAGLIQVSRVSAAVGLRLAELGTRTASLVPSMATAVL
jgi:hypothetical protein